MLTSHHPTCGRINKLPYALCLIDSIHSLSEVHGTSRTGLIPHKKGYKKLVPCKMLATWMLLVTWMLVPC